MNGDTERATVNVLDYDGDGGGVVTRRPAELDWATAVARPFAMARRRGTAPPLRFEWVGERRRDPWDANEPAPASSEWLDVITELAPGGGLLRLRLRRVEGESRPRVIARELRDDTGEVTQREMRRLGEGGVIARVDAALSDYSTARIIGEAWRHEVHRPGRRGRDPVFYAEWARRYVEACELAPQSPIKHLVEVERSAGRHATEAQIKAYLNRARARDLLTASDRGQAGGALTKTAERLLRSSIKEG